MFIGRNPAGGHDYDDTYKDWGIKIHHNIFKSQLLRACVMQQDFGQVFQNIFDDCEKCLSAHYQGGPMVYKPVFYNNTIFADKSGNDYAIRHFGVQSTSTVFADFICSDYLHAWDLNNIIDGAPAGNHYGNTYGINALIPTTTSTRIPFASPDFSSWRVDGNYFYRPNTSTLFRYNNTTNTAAQFESQSDTESPHNVYTQPYDSNNLLYVGTTGADKYRIRAGHTLGENNKTIADGGTGGTHPYLSGVTIPSFVGAVNSDDDAWVAGVLGLVDTGWLRSLTTGRDEDDNPIWIEGAANDNSSFPWILFLPKRTKI